jgi:phosphatidylserine/phosphatidylglycerophosphate/cardiolipin synthase-like enzyme
MAVKAKTTSTGAGAKAEPKPRPVANGTTLKPSQTTSGKTSGPPVTGANGLARPLINGRSSNGVGPDVDLTEPLDQMQKAVQGLGRGDFVYLAAWFFEPATQLTAGAYKGALTWGELFAKKAAEGVRIRILINDFDSLTGLDQWLKKTALEPLDKIINAMAAADRDNLKYMVQLHPAYVGSLKSLLAGQGGKSIHVASYHEKFMVTWNSKTQEMLAFCGGLDIESRKTPAKWSYHGLIGWHDIHVQLEGPITRDLERNFVTRWNLFREKNTRKALTGWKPMEVLPSTALSTADDAAAKKVHKLKTLRTESENGTFGIYSTVQEDVKEAYKRAIRGAKSFIYMENQYFRSIDLGNWIAEQGKANPNLVVIIVVVKSAAADDGANAVTAHGDYLQYTTFDLIMKGLGKRARIYTMEGRAVHSKFMLIDDKWMTIGSANANARSFELDTELNIELNDAALTKDFRVRLWAHNLGKPQADTRAWTQADFLKQWDLVASANDKLLAKPQDMMGEGIINMDYTLVKGTKNSNIPDALTRFDATPDGPLFAGIAPPHGTKAA